MRQGKDGLNILRELLNVQEDREAVGGVQVPVMGEENERDYNRGGEEGIE